MQATFCQRCYTELDNSGLSREWLGKSIEILPSQIHENGELVGMPVYEALNWDAPNASGYSREKLGSGMAFPDFEGNIWKIKVENPVFDKQKGKLRKYEHRKGVGTAPGYWVSRVPDFARMAIALRFGVTVPSESELINFWEWFNESKLPLLLTEGEKKALSLLQNGFPAISTGGCTSGYRLNQKTGVRTIAPGLEAIDLNREVAIAFDADDKQETIDLVACAVSRMAELLQDQGATVSVMQWNPDAGKGIDDVIVNKGAEFLNALWNSRVPAQSAGVRLAADLSLNIPCLSKADVGFLAQKKLLAIKSHKGTGKTKLMASIISHLRENARLLGEEFKGFAIVHRVTLGMQIAERFLFEMRNLAKSSIYGNELASCIEGFGMIDAERYYGGLLVIDEFCQVLQHLLTSATTRDRRPWLISQFEKYVKNADQIMIADADLYPDVVRFIETIRGEKFFVVDNTYRHNGFPINWYDSKNDSGMLAALLFHLENKEKGNVTVICSDSRAETEMLNSVILKQFPDLRVLLINQESTGEDNVKGFVANPDGSLGDYDVIIYSPTLGTGVSIESMDVVDSVWGFFQGGSLNTASMAQALSRVRDLVPRHVWVNDRMNHWNYSNSGSPKKIKEVLRVRLQKTAELTQKVIQESNSLVQDAMSQTYTWGESPFVTMYSQFIAADNRDGHNPRGNLKLRLIAEGNRINEMGDLVCPELKDFTKEIREEIERLDRENITKAEPITEAIAKLWKKRQDLTKEERFSLKQFNLKHFYCVEVLDERLFDFDNGREGQRAVIELTNFLNEESALEASVKSIDDLSQVKSPNDYSEDRGWEAEHKTVQDVNTAIARTKIYQWLGLGVFLDPDKAFSHEDYEPVAKKALSQAEKIKQFLGVGVSEKQKPTVIVHRLLEKLGVKMVAKRSGRNARVYRLDTERWDYIKAIVDRRAARAAEKEAKLAAVEPVFIVKQGGVEQFNPENSANEPITPAYSEADIEDAIELVYAAESDEEIGVLRQIWEGAKGFFELIMQRCGLDTLTLAAMQV